MLVKCANYSHIGRDSELLLEEDDSVHYPQCSSRNTHLIKECQEIIEHLMQWKCWRNYLDRH